MCKIYQCDTVLFVGVRVNHIVKPICLYWTLNSNNVVWPSHVSHYCTSLAYTPPAVVSPRDDDGWVVTMSELSTAVSSGSGAVSRNSSGSRALSSRHHLTSLIRYWSRVYPVNRWRWALMTSIRSVQAAAVTA